MRFDHDDKTKQLEEELRKEEFWPDGKDQQVMLSYVLDMMAFLEDHNQMGVMFTTDEAHRAAKSIRSRSQE